MLLAVSAVLYFKIADHFNIIDKPNARSSHSIPTIRGGGVIFLVATILFFVSSGFTFPYLVAAVLASGIVSFIDDVITVRNNIKFGVHALSVLLLFAETGLLTEPSYLALLGIGILIIGVINAYNFMDGINGITGLYSLSILIPLFLTEDDALIKSLEIYLILALLVFNFFNTRIKARCFAGDVGSITLAILIVFLVIIRIKETGSYSYFGLMLLYGIDSIYTIIQRLYEKEVIFKPHRKHLYQYLSNEKNFSQLKISFAYSIVQLGINIGIVFGLFNFREVVFILGIFSFLYWYVKLPIIKSQRRI